MNNVELKGITLLTLSLSVSLLGGCAGATEQVHQPRVQTAVARGGNTYVIKRASIRTPSADRFERAYADAVRPHQYRQPVGSSSGLTREQYQVRFEAEQRLQEEQAERARLWQQEHDAEKRQAMIRQDMQRKELEAKRKLYQSKWSQERKQKEAMQVSFKAKASQERARKKRSQVRSRPVKIRPILEQASAPMSLPMSVSMSAPVSTPISMPTPIVRSTAAPILLGAVRTSMLGAVRTSMRIRQPVYQSSYQPSYQPSPRIIRANARTGSLMDVKVESVIANAKKHIGSDYVWGGDSPATGFDCSGLVQHSLRLGAQVNVPRTAAEQYRASVKVADSRAARGDLVFFNTRGNSVSHVGIYLGGGRFLHAPRTGKTVTTTEISGYWKDRLIGFGRIPGACSIPLPT